MQIFDGKSVSEKILSQLKNELDTSSQKPQLDIVLVGDDPASLKYVAMKKNKAEIVGIKVQIHHFQDSTTQDLLNKIESLNQSGEVTAFLVQLPLPKNIDTNRILTAIDPKKDVDGLTPTSLGQLFHKDPQAIAPATALGVIKLLDEYQIDLSGKNAVIIGRSLEVGLPLFALLQSRNATITLCHSFTQNLKDLTRGADFVFSAVGKAGLIDDNYIKPGAIVVDIGLSLDDKTNKLVGDVDFEKVAPIAGFITPVPGGVGPMTIASLLSNTVDIWKRNKNL